MIDLSGICDPHGIAVFCTDDYVAQGTSVETKTRPDGSPANWPPIWYWATCQHNRLTSAPNGPFNSRSAALSNAAYYLAAYEGASILADCKLK